VRVSASRISLAIALLVAGAPAAFAASAPSRTPRPKSAMASARRVQPPAGLKPGTVRVLGAEERRFVGEPISLDLKDADIRDVLLTFAKLTKMNMVIDPEVRGTVTVRLEDVPWDQALEVILKVNGLGYVMERNVVRVAQPARLP
jgi:type II secretory pathway component GspD/PulD (secretin)